MKLYVGTKTLYAREMTRGEYNIYQYSAILNHGNPLDEGYLVEYIDGGKPNHHNHKGYISWSPKEVFERTYRKINENLLNIDVSPNTITFDEFVELVKKHSEYPHWHFMYKGYPATHGNDNEYYIRIENVGLFFRKNQSLEINTNTVILRDNLTKEVLVDFYINQNK